MSSEITSSYSTIQVVSEGPGAPQSADAENGQDTADDQGNPPGPIVPEECEPPVHKNEQETDKPPTSDQGSNESPGPEDKMEPETEEDFHMKDVKPAPADDRGAAVTASPMPQPRSKMNMHVVENQTETVDSTDEETKEPSPSSELTKPPLPRSTSVLATGPSARVHTVKHFEVRRSSSCPRPARPPPPVGYYGTRPSTPKSTMSSDNESTASSEQPSPVSPLPLGEQGLPIGVYRSMDGDKPAVPPRPPLPKQPYVSSASLTSQVRPPPPAFNPPPPPTDKEPLYNEIQFPAYLHILPEHDRNMSQKEPTNLKSRTSAHRSSIACTKEILEMLRWLKVVSKTDCMYISLYGVSLEEEIRTFHHTAQNLKKALRLFNLLMMKRGEPMRDHISELTFTSDALDKALKRKKTIQLAGGTTGAVGGVTAVVGLALAPVTLGASLIATAVGAGMVASAGGVSAHVAKAKKKIIARDGVERLVNDYTDKVKDIEHCLNFILSGMNELRRFDIARLQRAGAQPDALKIAHLTHSVFNSMDPVGRNPVTQAGGLSSERLLQSFIKELDYYFTEKDGQKLKKSRKSRFSGRVRLLAKNLQDGLDYLNHMWELFN